MEQRKSYVVAVHRTADLLENGFGPHLPKILPHFLRQQCDDLQVRFRPHCFRAFTQLLHLARDAGDSSIFLVRGSGGENNIGSLGRFRQEHFMDHDEGSRSSHRLTR